MKKYCENCNDIKEDIQEYMKDALYWSLSNVDFSKAKQRERVVGTTVLLFRNIEDLKNKVPMSNPMFMSMAVLKENNFVSIDRGTEIFLFNPMVEQVITVALVNATHFLTMSRRVVFKCYMCGLNPHACECTPTFEKEIFDRCLDGMATQLVRNFRNFPEHYKTNKGILITMNQNIGQQLEPPCFLPTEEIKQMGFKSVNSKLNVEFDYYKEIVIACSFGHHYMSRKICFSQFEPIRCKAYCKCIVCGVRATKNCSNCKAYHYCCREHQSAHWKGGHKKECLEIQKIRRADFI